jgi:hypothetical protein
MNNFHSGHLIILLAIALLIGLALISPDLHEEYINVCLDAGFNTKQCELRYMEARIYGDSNTWLYVSPGSGIVE